MPRLAIATLAAAFLLAASTAARAQGAPPPTTVPAPVPATMPVPAADSARRAGPVCTDANHDGRCDDVERPLACPVAAGGMSEPGRPCEPHPACVDADRDGRCDAGTAGVPQRGGFLGWIGRAALGFWVQQKTDEGKAGEGRSP